MISNHNTCWKLDSIILWFVLIFAVLAFIKLDRSQRGREVWGSDFENSRGCLIFEFYSFLCGKFKNFPNFREDQTRPRHKCQRGRGVNFGFGCLSLHISTVLRYMYVLMKSWRKTISRSSKDGQKHPLLTFVVFLFLQLSRL